MVLCSQGETEAIESPIKSGVCRRHAIVVLGRYATKQGVMHLDTQACCRCSGYRGAILSGIASMRRNVSFS